MPVTGKGEESIGKIGDPMGFSLWLIFDETNGLQWCLRPWEERKEREEVGSGLP